MKGLIVTADDFGASRQVNDAVMAAHENGILTATSLMVSAPAARDAVERARATPTLRVGLHIVLTDGRPTLPPAHIPDLVDSDGFFRNDMALTGAKMFFLPSVRRQLEAEIAAQFDAFHSTGLRCDHVNAHKHFHLHPTIAALMLDIGKHHGLKASRAPTEPVAIINAIEPTRRDVTMHVADIWARRLRTRFRQQGITMADHVFGLAWSGAMTAERVAALIDQLPPGTSEIYFHPATRDDFPGHAPGYRYPDEYAALIDPGVLAAIKRGGVTLAKLGDL
jgi:hopanoid biosynthesis associated protein HpnK